MGWIRYWLANDYDHAREIAAHHFKIAVNDPKLLVVEVVAAPKSKPELMEEALKEKGENWAFIIIDGAVALIGPGEAFTMSPTMYEEKDLNEGVKQERLQNSEKIVSDHTGTTRTIEVYVLAKKKTAAKT